jgi:curved DNA-binding protein CbpA
MKIVAVSFGLWMTQNHVFHCMAFLPTSLKANNMSLTKTSRLNYTNQIPDTTDPYAILNLPRGIISHQSIKRAYNEMAKKYHPSHRLSQTTSPQDKELIEMEFQRIHAAYEYLISRKRIDAGAAADGIGKVKVTIGMNGDPIVKGSHNSISDSQQRKKKSVSYEEWDSWDPNDANPDEEATKGHDSLVLNEQVEEKKHKAPVQQQIKVEAITTAEQNDLGQDDEGRKTVVLTEFLNKLHTLSESTLSSSKYFDKIHAVDANGTLVSLDLGTHVQLVSEEFRHLEQHVMELDQLASDLQDLQDTDNKAQITDSTLTETKDVGLDSKPLEGKISTQGKRVKINKAMELLSRNGNGSTRSQPKQCQKDSSTPYPSRTFTVRSDGPLPNSNILHLKDEFESVKRHLEESKKAIRAQLDEIEKDKTKIAFLGKELEERENYMREYSHSHEHQHGTDGSKHTIQRSDLGGPSGNSLERHTNQIEIRPQGRMPNVDPAIEELNRKASGFVAAKDLNTKINRLIREKRQLNASSLSEMNEYKEFPDTVASTKKGLIFYPAIENMGTDIKMLFLAHMFAHAMKKSNVVSFDTMKPLEETVKVQDIPQKNTEPSDFHLKNYHPSHGILNLELQKLIIQHMYAHLAQIRLCLKKGKMAFSQFQLPPQVHVKQPGNYTKRSILDSPRPNFHSNERATPQKPVLPPKPTSALQTEPEPPIQILHILPDTTDPFAILNLKKGEVNLAVIKRAYRQMAKICHPDKRMYINSSSKQRQVANEEFARVNAAYAYLTGKSQILDFSGETEYGKNGNHANKSKDDFYNYYRKPETQHNEYAPPHTFQKGDYVNIISGPHTDSHGTIMSIYPNMLKVEVNLSMSVFCMLHEVELDKSWQRQREREQRQTANEK